MKAWKVLSFLLRLMHFHQRWGAQISCSGWGANAKFVQPRQQTFSRGAHQYWPCSVSSLLNYPWASCSESAQPPFRVLDLFRWHVLCLGFSLLFIPSCTLLLYWQFKSTFFIQERLHSKCVPQVTKGKTCKTEDALDLDGECSQSFQAATLPGKTSS